MSLIPLIDPAVPPSLAMTLDMAKSIFTSTLRDGYDSRQRYLAKLGFSSRSSLRSDLEISLRDFLDLRPNEWSMFLVSKGVNALRLALRGAIPERDRVADAEVIVPAIGVAATVEAVLQERLRPVLVDVDPAHWHLDLGEAKKAITRRTVAMVSVDWLGTPVHLEEFRTFADENNLIWISDSAQSFGATWHSKPAVGVADATIYSLGYPKVFHTAGRGGILVVRPECAELLCDDPTQVLRHEIMPELNAAFGLSLLPALNQMLAHRRLAMNLYREHLSDIPGICFPLSPSGAVSNGYQVSMRIDPDRFGTGSKEVVDILIKNGIEASANRVENLARLYRAIPEVITSSQPRYAEVLDCFTLTAPISNHIPLATCEAICRIISHAHRPKSGKH